jgi:hypothetical protein
MQRQQRRIHNSGAGKAEMMRTGARHFLAILAGALCLVAQSTAQFGTGPSPDGYRAAYKAWRETDPGLERDAGTAGEALTPRTAKVAAAADAYAVSHGSFLRGLVEREAQNLKWLQSAEVKPLPDLAPAPDLIRFANREISAVSASSSTFANDPDRGIQQLRQAFQREQATLEILRAGIGDRQQAEEKASKAALAAEQARGKALDQYPILALALTQSADLMNQEATAWAAYYPALAEGSRVPAPPPAAPVSDAPAPVPSAPVSNPRPPSITPVPLTRYVGVWAYYPGDAFHGPEPESVELTVHEENGHATGTFSARFKLPPGGTGDAVVRFDLSGDFRATRNQTFQLKTGDGATGTVELIPGGPFNVLEVTFETDAKAGKINQGNMQLVKQ